MDPVSQFNTIFEYIEDLRIAVCKEHGQGIVQSQMQYHLVNHHSTIPSRTRHQIMLAAAAFPAWVRSEDEVPFPKQARAAIPHVHVYTDGFECTQTHSDGSRCTVIHRSMQGIQRHCRQEHQWSNPRKRGRSTQSGSIGCTAWKEGTWCQKVQPGGVLGRLFKVQQPDRVDEPLADGEEDAIQDAIRSSLGMATATVQAQIQSDDDRFEFQAWLNRAGWAQHLKRFDRGWLHSLCESPSPQEEALSRIEAAVLMVIWKAQQVSRPSVVGRPAMHYINRRDIGGPSNEKPFNARQTGKTMEKYSQRWVEIIRYIWRTHKLDEVPPTRPGQEETSVQGHKPAYRLTGRQQMALHAVQTMVGPDEQDEDIPEQAQDAVLTFIISLLDQRLGDDEYASPLMSGMAVLGIDTVSGWVSPLTYTPKQAAIVATSRMMVLYQAHQVRTREVEQIEAGGWARQDAMDMAKSHFDLVKDMANRFMTLTQYGGHPTPIDAIQRLKAYGMKIRYTTAAEGVVDWIGDTLLYGNIQFSMPQLRSMIHGLVAQARRELVEGLMMLPMDKEGGVTGDTALPSIRWDKFVDNPAERRMGWSFMEDARNHAAINVKEPAMWIGRQVMQTRALQEVFINKAATKEAMATGKPAVWKADGVRAYRQRMKKFRRSLTHGGKWGQPRDHLIVSAQISRFARTVTHGGRYHLTLRPDPIFIPCSDRAEI